MSESAVKQQTAVEVAEEAREKEWKHPSFLGEIFLGDVRWDLVTPFPEQSEEDRKIGDDLCARLNSFLIKNLDPDEVDRTGEVPKPVLDGLAELGCFAMKIPKEYGGLGLSQVNYNRAVALVASYCASTAVWLSAHQSIGVPKPLTLFGTPEQKQKYLPLFAKGAVSAFALTEPDVGSDPANMSTTAMPAADGSYYLINGQKLWCTNGPKADVLVVMARTPPKVVNGREKKQITAFIVEKNWPGIEVVHRCQFMGLHGIQNGLIKFTNVKVPKENILLGLGQGLKLALVTLNTGRLTMPAAVTAGAKWCLAVIREWGNKRVQWGGPIGRHEAISAKIAQMTSTTFAMDSVTWLSSAFADRKNVDIRLEAAAAKLFCTEASWRIVDATVQIRGGRGYETGPSLKARGEPGIAVERVMRDSRINTIIEGTSQVMRLFIAREALDPHAKRIFPLLDPHIPMGRKVSLAIQMAFHFALWYPSRWLPPVSKLDHSRIPGELTGHAHFVDRMSRKLSRELFHAMMRYQQGLEKKQRLLGRFVNIGTDLFAMAATCSRAASMASKNPSDHSSIELADLFCRDARKRVMGQFRGIGRNDDARARQVAGNMLDGKYTWLETGIIPPPK